MTDGVRLIDWARLTALVLLWGSAFALTALALETAPPALVVAVRLWIASVMLLGWCAATGVRMPRLLPRPDPVWGWLLALGVLGNAAPFYLNGWGQQVVPSSLASVLISSTPLVTVALAHVFVPGEGMTPRKALGFAVGFVGVVLLIGPAALGDLGGPTFIAQLAILAAALSYGTNGVLARRAPLPSAAVGAAGMVVIAAIIMTPFGAMAWLEGARPDAKAWAAMLGLGVGSTGLAAITYVATVRSAGPSFAALANYLMPIAAVIIGVGLLHERLDPSAYVAIAVVLAGIVLATRRPR